MPATTIVESLLRRSSARPPVWAIALATCCSLFAGASAVGEEIAQPDGKYALLIGVGNYRHEQISPLPWVANDVGQLAGALSERGDYRDNSIVRIFDCPADADPDPDVLPPTRTNLKQTIERFLRERKADDSVLIYFSGHGARANRGSLYLLPSDYEPDNLEQTGIDADWLRGLLAACPARVKLFVIDSCFAGKGGSLLPSSQIRDSFRDIDSVMVLASSSEDEFSYPWRDQSLFSYWFTQALKGDADSNSDGSVTFDEVYHFVHGRVVAEAARIGKTQTPVRFVGTKIQGSPELIHLRPQPIKTVIGDMARKIAWAVRSERLGPVVTASSFLQTSYAEMELRRRLGNDYGMLGATIAQNFRDELWTEGGRHFAVNSRDEVLQRLGNRHRSDVVLTFGEFIHRENTILNLRAKAIERATGRTIIDVGGSAQLDPDEYGELGVSFKYDPNEFRKAGDSEDAREGTAKSADDDPAKEIPQPPRHLMQDPEWPFLVRILVDDKKRPPWFQGDRAYVELAEGESFDIRVDYDRDRKNYGQRVFLKLFVDGVCVREPEFKTPQLGAEVKQQSAAAPQKKGITIVQATKPRYLRESLSFLLDEPGFTFRGYYWKDFHRPFQVVGADDSLAASLGRPDRIGLITAAFYEEVAKRGQPPRSQGALGVAPGPKKPGGIKFVPAGEIGLPLGYVHVHYVSPEEMARLKRSE